MLTQEQREWMIRNLIAHCRNKGYAPLIQYAELDDHRLTVLHQIYEDYERYHR